MNELYARHEEAVLRFFVERLRSPELACDLTAETFATALAQTFDPSRQTEAAWSSPSPTRNCCARTGSAPWTTTRGRG